MTEGNMLMFHNSDETDICFMRGQEGDYLETMEKEAELRKQTLNLVNAGHKRHE